MDSFDLLLSDARIATMATSNGYGLIENGAIGIVDDRIAWIGDRADAPAHARQTENLGGRLVTPGLIDCHTHLIFGGQRSAEFEARLNGASYAEIAQAGGGIVSTVAATNACTPETLIQQATPRLEALKRDGVTTVEIKSGYGLDLDGERAMLRAARAMGRDGSVRIVTTLLGLHALPPAWRDRADDYVAYVINQVLPAIAAEGLADAVDAYVEPIAFSSEQADRFFLAAAKLGLRAKLHADQLSDCGGATLAGKVGALSADHIEYSGPSGIAAMARAGTVAVLLPGAFLTLRETQRPPIDALRAAGVPMAVATDCNPGTSPMTSLLLAMNLSCTLFGLTPAEALAGTTRHAARALGLVGQVGVIAPDAVADLAIWDADSPAELSYWMGLSRLSRRCVGGVLSASSPTP